MNLIYLMGKSSSGKDTIYKKLKENDKYNSYVLYTSRPMREGEKDGEEYHFLSNEQMQSYIDGEEKNKVIEYRTYNTVYGPWTYATIDDEQFKTDKDILIIGTLESYIKIKQYFRDRENVKILPVYIEVPDNIRLKRAIEREEQGKGQYEELCRRFLADSKDFSEENLKKAGIEKKFVNMKLDRCIQEINHFIEN